MSNAQEPAPVIGLLGPLCIWQQGTVMHVPGRLDRIVLAHLVLAEGRAVSVDVLIDALWRDRAPDLARNALQVKVSRLRRLLGDMSDRLLYSQGSYRLDLPTGGTDLDHFTALAASAEQQLASGDSEAATRDFDQALDCWRGQPLADLDEHPRFVAARRRLAELQTAAMEGRAVALSHGSDTRARGIAELRTLLESDPFRSRARLALMHSLDAIGRRAEAIAVYDAGRRLYVQGAGIEPPAELQEAFTELLASERRAARRADYVQRQPRTAPEGLLEISRWLAADDELNSAVRLALRGAWWWWIGGKRGAARDLLQELLELAVDTGSSVDHDAYLSAQAWHSVFASTGLEAAQHLEIGRQALRSRAASAWTKHDALAAALLSERLYERGERDAGDTLLPLATERFARLGDEWGEALCGIIAARAVMLSGDIPAATQQARALLSRFHELNDPAGQVTTLDVLGYCAEVRGELNAAAEAHTRALDIAVANDAPDWIVGQMTRLGNVRVLRHDDGAIDMLQQAVTLSVDAGCEPVIAMCRNGLGVAYDIQGMSDEATSMHKAAFEWYVSCQSKAGVAYTAARLAMVDARSSEAKSWAVDSVHKAVVTKDPRAIAHSLEAFGLTVEERALGARALGAASALRRRYAAPLPHLQRLRIEARCHTLRDRMGSGFDVAWRQGVGHPSDVLKEL